MAKIFKKKLDSYEFFEYIIKRDKKEGMPHHYNSYTSTGGIDYYDLYKKGKSKLAAVGEEYPDWIGIKKLDYRFKQFQVIIKDLQE